MLYLLAVRVAVLGFGWAGVLAAGFLLERFPGAEVVAFDKSRRLGGLLSSVEVNGFTLAVRPIFQKHSVEAETPRPRGG